MKLAGENLSCERGERVVFTGVSFEVGAGELLILKGPNGAGKTSLLRLVAGLNEPVAGTIALEDGHDDLTIGQQSHFVAHQNAMKPALSVSENLEFWSGFLGGGDLTAALDAFGLSPLATYSTALLSAGQLRRLNLARLRLIPRPLWLLDEPTVGLDAESSGRLRDLMAHHLSEGGLIVAATHIDLGMARASVFDFSELRDIA